MEFKVGKKYKIVDKTLSDFCGCTVEEGDVYECHEIHDALDDHGKGCCSKDVHFMGSNGRSPYGDVAYVFATESDLEIGAVVEVEE